MLGPVSESVFGEQDLLNLNLHAIDRFPSFNAELERAAGSETGLRTEGTLAVAYDNGDLAALDRLTDFRHSIGLKAERLDARECRRREPFLAPSTRGGVFAAGDLSVDNRRYLAALRAAAAAAGVRTVRGHRHATSRPAGHRPRPAPGDVRRAQPDASSPPPHVVVAAGHATRAHRRRARRRSARRSARSRARSCACGTRETCRTSSRHTVRAIVQGHDLYLVPRADGELVVGATQEERDDRDVTAGAVHDLLRDATTAVPAVSELIFAEASAGLRPGTSDNGPILGPVAATGRLIIAAGHYRNGILLSAVTADAVAALLDGKDPHAAWTPFHPGQVRR